ncbi:NLR family CARD domain-containing protein 4-like [Diadema antillarum]|uniref:NLR family CARD domain-containing protein 4-like n=1 Tax=Diadema antillarum TaxID=105358 RepID=UPI003A87DF48
MFSEGMSGKKTNVNYDGFITHLESLCANSEQNNRIALFGEAGVGKSTFLAKLTLDWASGGRLNAFDLLFLIPLREIERNTYFGDTIIGKLTDEVEFDGSRLEEYIQENQQNVLILYDGFDEYRNDIEGNGSDDAVIAVLRGEKFTCSPVIVTTRPWRVIDIKSDTEVEKRYRFFEIEGFTETDVETYISKSFPNNAEARNGLFELMTEPGSFVRENMTPYPIFCRMLCYIWQNEGSRGVLQGLETLAQLFDEMLRHLKDHFAGKEKDYEKQRTRLEQAEGCLKSFAKDAMDSLLENKLVFGEEDLKTSQDDLETVCEIGVLTRKERFVSRRKNNRRETKYLVEYRIPHKLFQEYLAGMHLASLYEGDREQFQHLLIQLMANYRSTPNCKFSRVLARS